MSKCLHGRFSASVEVSRIGDHPENRATKFYADVRVKCDECGAPFKFKGMLVGLDPAYPRVSMDCQKARLPIEE